MGNDEMPIGIDLGLVSLHNRMGFVQFWTRTAINRRCWIETRLTCTAMNGRRQIESKAGKPAFVFDSHGGFSPCGVDSRINPAQRPTAGSSLGACSNRGQLPGLSRL